MDLLSILTRFSVIIGVVLLLLLICVYIVQNKVLYIPVIQGQDKSPDNNPQGARNPSDQQLPYEDIHIVTSDKIKLHGWICKQPESQKCPTVIYFHENAGNIGTRVFFMKKYYTDCKVNIVLVAYRGYSKSEGTPTEQGLKIDAQAIIQHIFQRKDIDPTRIYLHGRSLGGAVTIYAGAELSNQFPFKGLIIENTFLSIPDMAKDLLPKVLYYIVRLVLHLNWPSKTRIQKVSTRSLFVFSMHDEIVPVKHMVTLFALASNIQEKQKLVIEQASHNDTWYVGKDTYFNGLTKFIYELKN